MENLFQSIMENVILHIKSKINSYFQLKQSGIGPLIFYWKSAWTLCRAPSMSSPVLQYGHVGVCTEFDCQAPRSVNSC